MPGGPPIVLCGSLSQRAHALGARMHNAGYAALGLPFTYVPFEIEDLAGALAGMRALGIRGLGIAFGFKVAILPLLDFVDPLALRIGAVNTVVNRGGGLTGYNSDAVGACRALAEAMPLPGKRAVIVGAGGAARAVAHGLAAEGMHVHLVNRTPERARSLADELDEHPLPGVQISAGALADLLDLTPFDALVNCSTAGMAGSSAESPVASELLHERMVVMDIVYKPLATQLLAAAERAGCATVHGGRMLLFQACRQFELYTGVPAPESAMEAALTAAMANS